MSELSFLSSCGLSPAQICEQLVEVISSGGDIYNFAPLTQPQIHKLVVTLKFLANQPKADRSAILAELKCPEHQKIANIVDAFEPVLKTKDAVHELRDFDWSASLVLGTSTISNIKEPLCTFRFDTTDGKQQISRNIELSVEEAEQLLSQLEAARKAQRELMNK